MMTPKSDKTSHQQVNQQLCQQLNVLLDNNPTGNLHDLLNHAYNMISPTSGYHKTRWKKSNSEILAIVSKYNAIRQQTKVNSI